MKVKIDIRRNSDNVIRSTPYEWEYPDCEFNWLEGNYCCDCNRGLFFNRICNEEDPDHSCGETKYAIRIVSIDGYTFYQDPDWERS